MIGYLYGIFKSNLMLVFVLSILFVTDAIGQDTKIDSLKNILLKTKHDSIHCRIMLELGEQFENTSYDSANFYYNKIRHIANNSQNNDEIIKILNAEALLSLGWTALKIKDFEKTIEYLNQSSNVYESIAKTSKNKNIINKAQIGISKVLKIKGTVYLNQNEYDLALEFYQKSLEISKSLGDNKGIASCYHNIGNTFFNQQKYDLALHYYLNNIPLCKETKDIRLLSLSYNSVANIYGETGNNIDAIKFYELALNYIEEINDFITIAEIYSNIGFSYKQMGKYSEAIENILTSIKICENINYKSSLSLNYTHLGWIHHALSNWVESEEFFNNSLLVAKENELNYQIGISYYGLGAVLYSKATINNICVLQRDSLLSESLLHFHNSQKFAKLISNNQLFADCNNAIGLVQLHQLSNINEESKKKEKIKSSEILLKKAQKVYEEINHNYGISNVNCNLSFLNYLLYDTYTEIDQANKLKYLEKAVQYGEKAYKIAKEYNIIGLQNEAAEHLKKAYSKLNKLDKALKYADIYISTKDSLFNEEKTKAIVLAEVKFKSEKKQLEIEKLNNEKELQNEIIIRKEAVSKKQRAIILSSFIGIILILFFSIFLYRMYLQKKNANFIIEEKNASLEKALQEIYSQKEEITSQRDEIEAQRDSLSFQNRLLEEQKIKISDSITYAKQIQSALLPSNELTEKLINEYFVLFKPKDVVSGDFYWLTKTEKWTIVVVSDCTGHGVPGAFMSILGISLLNEIVRKKEINTAADILNNLRSMLIDALKQTGVSGSQKDGMDISVLAIDNEKRLAMWAGAYNPIWIIKNTPNSNGNKIIEINADKMPVSIHIKMEPFTNHFIELEPNDRVYMFSDGFADQYGGSEGKKFMKRNLKSLIEQTSYLPIDEQGMQIEMALENWINANGQSYEQIDDITVLGLKI